MNKHKDLALAFGICWHEWDKENEPEGSNLWLCTCGKYHDSIDGINPDFTAQIEVPLHCDACGGSMRGTDCPVKNASGRCPDMPCINCEYLCPTCNGRMTRLITRVQVEAEKDGTWERFAEHLWSKTHSEKYCDKPLSTYDIYKILTDANALVDEYHKWRMGGNDETN